MELNSRLKLLRTANDLTLEELAYRMGGIVSKQALSKYERGEMQPSAKVVTALAKALNVSTSNLMFGPEFRVEPVAFRTAKAASSSERSRVESHLIAHLERVTSLRRTLGELDCQIPIQMYLCNSVDDAELAANELRDRWSLGSDPIANLIEALEARSVSVCLLDSCMDTDGLSAIAKNCDQDAIGAAVLSKTGITHVRQRATLAHELGHIVCRVAEDVDEEKVAWRFMGAFLAPRDSLIRDVGRSRSSIAEGELLSLKRKYGMSMGALALRLVDVGVLSRSKGGALFGSLRKRIQENMEPGDVMAFESPQWIIRAVARARSEKLISENQASQFVASYQMVDAVALSQTVMLAKLDASSRRTILDSITVEED